MGDIVEVQTYLQIVLLIMTCIPVLYWIRMKIAPVTVEKRSFSGEIPDVTVLLPMRNEKKNVNRKLESLMADIETQENCKLLVVVSGSDDSTETLVEEFLEKSIIDNSRWSVEAFAEPGKSLAINRAMEKIETEIVIMTDADANVSPGWLSAVIDRLEEESVGVVSGFELEEGTGQDYFNRYYRRNSNWLRLQESIRDSTPVMEGSLIAWKVRSLGEFSLDESLNADDSQIGLRAIREGYRSVIDGRISFRGFGAKRRTIQESIRRSQGLSRALLKNTDLAFYSGRRKSRLAILNALSLYVVFPWTSLLFSLNSIIALAMERDFSANWPLVSILLVLLMLITPQGRSLVKGAMISLIAHIQFLLGNRYNIWNPVR